MVTGIPFAERSLVAARAAAVRNIAAPPIQPLSRTVLVEQPRSNTQHGNAPVKGQLASDDRASFSPAGR